MITFFSQLMVPRTIHREICSASSARREISQWEEAADIYPHCRSSCAANKREQIKEVHSFVLNDGRKKITGKFHLVILQEGVDPAKFVEKTDFNCSKSTYNGYELYIPHPRSVTERVIEIDPSYYPHPIFFCYRVAKYLEKGFCFVLPTGIKLHEAIPETFELGVRDGYGKMVRWLLAKNYFKRLSDHAKWEVFEINMEKFVGFIK